MAQSFRVRMFIRNCAIAITLALAAYASWTFTGHAEPGLEALAPAHTHA